MRDPVPIAIYSPPARQAFGHNHEYVGQLGTQLAALGHPVTAVCRRGPRPLPSALETVGPSASRHSATDWLQQRRSPTARGLSRAASQRALLAVLDDVTRSGEHFTIFESYEYMLLARHLRARSPGKAAVVFHDANFSLGTDRPAAARLYKAASRRAARSIVARADRVFVHGPAIAETLTQELDLSATDRHKIVTLHYGSAAIDDVPEREVARRHLGVPADGHLIVYFGTMRQDKGYEPVIRALHGAPAWRVLLAGPNGGVDLDRLRRLACVTGVEDRLLIQEGFIPDEKLPWIFGAADLVACLYPRGAAHQSGSLHLARQYRRPVLASGNNDILSYVKMAGVGHAVEEPTEAAVRTVLVQHAAAPQELRNALETALKQASGRYTWSAMAAQVSEAIRDVD